MVILEVLTVQASLKSNPTKLPIVKPTFQFSGTMEEKSCNQAVNFSIKEDQSSEALR